MSVKTAEPGVNDSPIVTVKLTDESGMKASCPCFVNGGTFTMRLPDNAKVCVTLADGEFTVIVDNGGTNGVSSASWSAGD